MNYCYPLLAALVLLILFHALLIFARPQSKKFWKIVDYFWVSLGFIGIIGAMTSLKKEFSTARKNLFEQPLIFNYNDLKESSVANYRYFADTVNGFKYADFEDQNQAKNFKKAGEFFKSYSNELLHYKDTILIHKNLNYVDTLKMSYNKFLKSMPDSYVKQTTELTGFHLKELERSKNEYLENDDLTHKNSFDWLLLFVFPYLLAAAIAIRLTKVTAEIKDLK